MFHYLSFTVAYFIKVSAVTLLWCNFEIFFLNAYTRKKLNFIYLTYNDMVYYLCDLRAYVKYNLWYKQ